MDIDLIAGLVKPKIAKTELPTLPTAGPAEDALPDFTALLAFTPASAAEIPKTPTDSEIASMAISALPQAVAPATPPDFGIKASESAVEGEVPEAATGTDTRATLSETGILTESPLVTPAKPTNEAVVAHQIPSAPAPETRAKIMAEPRAAAPLFTPESAPVTIKQPEPRVVSDMWVRPEKAEVKPVPAPPIPSASLQPAAVVPPVLPSDKANILTEKPPVEPKNEPALGLVKPMTKPATQPSSPVQANMMLSEMDPKVDDPAETHFSIKMDHQTHDIKSISRPTQHPSPVSSQITAQLPQLLTKAEKQSIELRLDPPELGRVTIHLSTHDSQVIAHVVTERGETTELMRRHAELLSTTLANAGFTQADLSFQQGQTQGSDDESEQFQLITDLSERGEPQPTTQISTGQDGRLDIRL